MTELLQKLVDAVKGLTWVNVGILAALVVLMVPIYFGWRVLGDPMLMGAVFSDFREIRSPTECNLVFAQPAGGTGFYAVSNSFAERRAEFWSVTVRIKFEPDEKAMEAYCAALGSLIDYARDRSEPVPTFPGSDRKMFYPAPGDPPNSRVPQRSDFAP